MCIMLVLTILSTSTIWCQVKYELPCRSDLLYVSRGILQGQIGTKEKTGHNDGVKIVTYQQSAGVGKGGAYCYAGQYYCFWEACNVLHIPYSNIPIKRTGLANAGFADAMQRGKQVQFVPAINDLLTWKYETDNTGHVERIDSVMDRGWVHTVGFNTSNGLSGSQKEGNGVYPRLRNIFHPLARFLNPRGLIGFYNK